MKLLKKLRRRTKETTEEFAQLNKELIKMAEVRGTPGLLGITQMVEQTGNAMVVLIYKKTCTI